MSHRRQPAKYNKHKQQQQWVSSSCASNCYCMTEVMFHGFKCWSCAQSHMWPIEMKKLLKIDVLPHKHSNNKWDENKTHEQKMKIKTGWKHNECVWIKEIHRPKSWNNNEKFYIGFLERKKDSKHKKTLEQLKTKKEYKHTNYVTANTKLSPEKNEICLNRIALSGLKDLPLFPLFVPFRFCFPTCFIFC